MPLSVKFFVALLCCALTILSGCTGRHRSSVLAEVWKVEPDAPAGIKIGDVFGPGSHVRTTSEQTVMVSFIPGIFAMIRGDADIAIESLEIAADGNETGSDAIKNRDVRLRLLRGTVTFSLPSDGGAHSSSLFIENSISAVTAETGALFVVFAGADELRVTCARGKVSLSGANHTSLAIDAGEWCGIHRGEPLPGLAKLAAEDGPAEEALEAGIAAERTMRELLTARQHAVPWWRHP